MTAVLANAESSVSAGEQESACLHASMENPYRLMSLWEMVKFSVADLVLILDQLSTLDRLLKQRPDWLIAKRSSLQPFVKSVNILQKCTDRLGLTSSSSQAKRVLLLWSAPPLSLLPGEFIGHLEDLQRRIRDDLQERLFFCVEADKAQWIVRDGGIDPTNPHHVIPLRLKTPIENFGQTVTDRLGAIEADLAEATRCYVYGCNAACIFHLMRATEIAVPKIANLCDISDPKPSWGAVLDQAEKYTQRTKYDELPPTIQPHIDF